MRKKIVSHVNTVINIHAAHFEMKSLEFFAINTMLPEMTILASKDFTAAKNVTPIGT